MARIAVIDDDPGFIALTSELFEDRGWETATCREARLAVECVQKADPDVVLLDVWMDSGANGWDILEALKSCPTTATIPVIVCSAASLELQTRESWMRERGIGFLSKPFDIDDLYELVETVVRPSPNRAAQG